MTTSILSGSSFSTSFFTLLSKNGLKIWCNQWIKSNFSSSFNSTASFSALVYLMFYPLTVTFWSGFSNHFLNSSQLEKIFGRMKFNKAQSSPRSFYKGVPVKSNLFAESYEFPKIFENLDFEFFILWPSSTMIYCHWSLFKEALSLII